MQYLHDDTVQPLRFFTKIVMRCVNDALDYATGPQRQIHENSKTSETRLTEETPPQVCVPVDVLKSASKPPKLAVPPASSTRAYHPPDASDKVSAVHAGSAALVCGFIDGHVTLTSGCLACSEGGPTGTLDVGKMECVEVPPLDPSGGPVLALDAVAAADMQWAVAVAYRKSVFVFLTNVRKSEGFSISRRRKYQQRIIGITSEQFPVLETVSSVKLSPNAAHISVCCNGDKNVTIVSLPPLRVPRDTDVEEVSRVVVGSSARVAYDEASSSCLRLRVFYMPGASHQRVSFGVKTQTLTTLSNGASLTNFKASTTGSPSLNGAMVDAPFNRDYVLGLVLWMGSSSFSRCPLRISGGDVGGTCAALPGQDATGAGSGAEKVTSPMSSRNKGMRYPSEKVGKKSRALTATGACASSELHPLPGVRRGLLPSVIVAAEVAGGDGSLIAAACGNYCVYILDARGIVSVCNATSSLYGRRAQVTGLAPHIPDNGYGWAPWVTMTLKTGNCTTLAHMRGLPLKSLEYVGAAMFLHEIDELLAAVTLGDLPLILLFCGKATYLWDVLYNRVIARMDDLPPLQPITTYELKAVAVMTGSHSGSSKQQQLPRQQQQQQYQEHRKGDVFCPIFFDNAVWWPSTDGSMACLTVNGLLRSVYPTLTKYFPHMTSRALTQVLECLPPRHRHNEAQVAALEFPAETSCRGPSDTVMSNTISSGSMFPLAAQFRAIQLSNIGFGLDAVATQFLEGVCNVSSESKEEVTRLLDSARF